MSRQFQTLSARTASAVGVLSLAYAFSFNVLEYTTPLTGRIVSSLCLLIIGLLLVPLGLGLYLHMQKLSPEFSLLGLLITVVAATGSLMHAGYDLANAINVPYQTSAALANLPNQTDPRGLAVFGLSSLAIALWSWLLSQDKSMPAGLSKLGYGASATMLLIYILRLFIVYVDTPLMQFPLLVAGFLLTPIWYLWLGVNLSKPSKPSKK